MNGEFLNFHGRVRAFRNGKLIWDRPNKITTLGRKALLAAMTHKTEIPEETTEGWWIPPSSKWKFHPESWISCFAVGNGGGENNTASSMASATSMADKNLWHIVPFRPYNEEVTYSNSIADYVKLPSSSELTINTDYRIDRFGDERLDPDKYLFFKRVTAVDLSSTSLYSSDDSSVDQTYARLGSVKMETPVAAFSINISQEDIIRFGEEGKPFDATISKINELSLYIANVEPGLSGHPSEFKKYGPDSMPTLPIQFSHIAFPTENFYDNTSKDLDLEYYIFA